MVETGELLVPVAGLQEHAIAAPACTLPGVEQLAAHIQAAIWGCCEAVQRSKAAHGLQWGCTDILQKRWFTLMELSLVSGLVELMLRHTKVSCTCLITLPARGSLPAGAQLEPGRSMLVHSG